MAKSVDLSFAEEMFVNVYIPEMLVCPTTRMLLFVAIIERPYEGRQNAPPAPPPPHSAQHGLTFPTNRFYLPGDLFSAMSLKRTDRSGRNLGTMGYSM